MESDKSIFLSDIGLLLALIIGILMFIFSVIAVTSLG
jgi:hypothetical protein